MNPDEPVPHVLTKKGIAYIMGKIWTYRSDCCSAPPLDPDSVWNTRVFGRCGRCKEMTRFYQEEKNHE